MSSLQTRRSGGLGLSALWLLGCSTISESGTDGKAAADSECLYCATGGATTFTGPSPYVTEREPGSVPDPCLPATLPVNQGGWGISEKVFEAPGTPGALNIQFRIYDIPHDEGQADIYAGFYLSAHLVLLPDEMLNANDKCADDGGKEIAICAQQLELEPLTYRYSGPYIAPVAFIHGIFPTTLNLYRTRTCGPHTQEFGLTFREYLAVQTNNGVVAVDPDGAPYGKETFDATTEASLAIPPMPITPIDQGVCIVANDVKVDPYLTRFQWNGLMRKPSDDPASPSEFVVAPDGVYALWVEATAAEGQSGSVTIATFQKGPKASTPLETAYFEPGLPESETAILEQPPVNSGIADLRLNWLPQEGPSACAESVVEDGPDNPDDTTPPPLPDAGVPEDVPDDVNSDSEDDDLAPDVGDRPSTGSNPFGD